MRLIDADALIESLQVDQKICFGCPEPEWLNELIQILDNAPTIEMEEIQKQLININGGTNEKDNLPSV